MVVVLIFVICGLQFKNGAPMQQDAEKRFLHQQAA
jgi:hypothetical protein